MPIINSKKSPSSRDTTNWGIIGLGHIAHKFAADLKLIPNATLHAVASTSGERAQNFAAQHDAYHYYDSYNGILDCPELDVVYIATRHPQHCETTLMCLENNIPVLCEKPLAMNAHEVQKMIAAAQENDTFLMEALWTRFLPTIAKVLELIEAGTIGDVTAVKADFGFKANPDPNSRLFNQAEGGGALLDIGIYPLFISLLLLGQPKTIKTMTTFGKTKVDETISMLLQYADNKTANLQATILNTTPTEAYIFGTKGAIRMNTRWHEATSLTLLLDDAEPKNIFFEFIGYGYNYEAKAMMEYLDKGVIEHPLMPHDFSLQLIQLLDKVRAEAGIVYPEYDHISS